MDATDAGRLFTFAVDVSATPGSTGDAGEYAALVDRYRQDARFKTTVDALFQGLSCEVAVADQVVGIVPRPLSDSPLVWPQRTTDLPWNQEWSDKDLPSGTQRAARALTVIGLFAYVCPSAADFDGLLADPNELINPVGVRDLEQFIRDFCEQREQELGHPGADSEQRPVWWAWLQMPAESATSDRIARGTTTYVVYNVLSTLTEWRLMVDTTPAQTAADKAYRPRRRLIAHFRELVADELFVALQQYANPDHNTTTAAADLTVQER